MAPNSPALSPNAKAIISLSLLALAHVTAIIIVDNFNIIKNPPIPKHSFWNLKASVKDWFRGLQALTPRAYSTYLQLSQFVSTHKSFTQRDLAFMGLSAVTLISWTTGLGLLRDKQTRYAVWGSRVALGTVSVLISVLVSFVSITIWGYIPCPMFSFMGYPWNNLYNGVGSKKSDEESLKELVDVDVGQEKA